MTQPPAESPRRAHKPRAAAAVPAAARADRERAVADLRRGSVLAAARAAFFDLGLEGASLREIAKRAGYTPGALYSYFDSKEAVYGALLAESLERLNERVGAAAAAHAEPAAQARATATAFFEFYREHPRDLDLGFYLFRGMQPRGLTPALNEPLNARLADALAPTRKALERLGTTKAQAQAEVTALLAQIAGLLLLSHTGRIRMFGQASDVLFERYVAQLLARAGAARKKGRPT